MPLKSALKPCRIRVVAFHHNHLPSHMCKLFSVQNLPAAFIFLLFSVTLFGQQVPVGPPPSAQSPFPTREPQKEDKDRKAEPSVGAAVDPNTYKAGPADVLMVRVWNEDKFSGPVVVHQDGKITLPLVGDVDAGGTTPKDIEAAISKALSKYVVKPLVTVTVQEVESKKYYLDGMVNRAGEYPLAVPTTILEALSKGGGVQDFANKKKIYVLRGDKKIPFNYKEVMNGKNMDQNIRLEPGDHIVVP
jgi:polysaccharide export outer membrane protein